MLTRKDFEREARIIANVHDKKIKMSLAAHSKAVFARSNPRFDSQRFEKRVEELSKDLKL